MLPWSGRDGRFLQVAVRSVTLFRDAIPYVDGRVMVLEVPYQDGLTIPAYFFLPPPSKRLGVPGNNGTPVVVHFGEADSTQEELYYAFASVGFNLGYAVLTFDGPGQSMMLKKNKTAMRPDFEVVSAKVLDHLQLMATNTLRLGLDLYRIAIIGASMGAYYALRSSIDPRIKGLRVDKPILRALASCSDTHACMVRKHVDIRLATRKGLQRLNPTSDDDQLPGTVGV